MFLVTHPVGNQNVRELLKALVAAEQLHSFHTSISYSKEYKNIIPKGIEAQLARRKFSGVPDNDIYTYPFFDVCRLISKKLGMKSLSDNSKGLLRPNKLYEYVDNKTASFLLESDFEGVDCIYGYDSKCLNTFRKAKERDGIKLYYEAAFGNPNYVAKLMEEESHLSPDWISSIPVLDAYTLARQQEEADMADHLIVASNFARSSFYDAGFDGKISVVNYGAPLPNLAKEAFEIGKEKIEVIYVGALTQQKGISYLFDAVSKVSSEKITLTLIGNDYSNGKNIRLAKLLEQYKWLPSVPHNEVLSELSKADVLVLPSIAEAFGLVVLEAFSQGVVVIVSEHCGGADVVNDGVNGFVVPIRDSEAIAEKLEVLYSDADLLARMKLEALKTARNNTWNSYSKNLRIALGL